MTVKPAWGLSYVIPENAVAAWGMRLIVTQQGDVDMVPDRQGGDAGPHTAELLALLDQRVPLRQLNDTISTLLKGFQMHTRAAEDFILHMDDRLCIHANTNGSAGYCYVTAWLWEESA